MEMVLGFNKKERLLKVWFSPKVVQMKTSLRRTSKKSVKAVVYNNKICGIRIDFNRKQNLEQLSGLLVNEFGLTKKLAFNLMNDIAFCSFSPHNLSDTLH